MNITHELMAQVFQHVATLHAELARMHHDSASLTQENVRLSKQVQETARQRAHENGQVGAVTDPDPARHAAVARRHEG